ncbi:MAG: type VI secretion system baseplate subunit TssE [Paracoccaceae bacterium]
MATRDGLFQVSLMNVFRQAARERDAKTKDSTTTDDGGRVLSTRTIERREGANQATLKDHLAQDLGNLMGTIHLAAAQSLDGLPHVQKSVLNYGMQDMTRLTSDDFKNSAVVRDLKAALLEHEPRLIPESLVIKLRSNSADKHQRIAFDIRAEMAARPVDVPLEFVAEIDTGAGKVALADLVVRG